MLEGERKEAAYLKSTGSWSRKPVSRSSSPFSVVAPPPLIPNLYKSTFRLHGFQNRAASRYAFLRGRRWIYFPRCWTVTDECAANTLLDLEIGVGTTRCRIVRLVNRRNTLDLHLITFDLPHRLGCRLPKLSNERTKELMRLLEI